MKNYLINFKFENIIIFLIPVALITGPAIPDIMAFCLSIYFLINIIKKKKFHTNDNYWIYLSFLLWFWFIFISFFAYDAILSFKDAIIFIRYVIFIIAIVYFFECRLNQYDYLQEELNKNNSLFWGNQTFNKEGPEKQFQIRQPES